MKDGFSLKNLFSSLDGKYGDLGRYSYIGDEIILSIFIIFICLVGLVGNGTVIWLLGFRVKRKPFATYFLNLAVADFGCLMVGFTLNVLNILTHVNGFLDIYSNVFRTLITFSMFMYSSSQLFLTAIGIDRCVSVVFPNWYQFHRSLVWSFRVGVLIWALSFMLGGVPFIVVFTSLESIPDSILFWVPFVSTLICILLVIVSVLTLVIKIHNKSQLCQCGNLLKVVLLMLLSFLLFSVLPYASLLEFPFILLSYSTLGSSLKSSVNPLIYFLAGRQKRGKFLERMKAILQRVFKEDRNTKTELHPHIETQL